MLLATFTKNLELIVANVKFRHWNTILIDETS